ncbi:MAG: GerMN domain-containing protein [bacterium]|nr:GerMN domain-containing protein [bacterium]
MGKVIGVLVVSVLILVGISFAAVSLITKPVIAPTLSPSPQASAFPNSTLKQKVTIFLVSIEDNGSSGPKIGCNDSIIPVEREINESSNILQATINELLGIQAQAYQQAGLYSAFYNSNLRAESAIIENGIATIKIVGTLSPGGICDIPRIEEQLNRTVRQFEQVKQVEMYINDKPLKEFLSEKG